VVNFPKCIKLISRDVLLCVFACANTGHLKVEVMCVVQYAVFFNTAGNLLFGANVS
jgi:hypothetical protein